VDGIHAVPERDDIAHTLSVLGRETSRMGKRLNQLTNRCARADIGVNCNVN
jgi:hypothetical protein